MRAAVTLEQCWHRTPGGTGVAAIETVRALGGIADLTVSGVVGRHRGPATAGFEPPVPTARLPLGGPLLYESWLRLGWPRVESVVGADLVHSTTIIPAATALPHVVTIHDLAFLRHPEYFTKRGNRIFRRSLAAVRTRADLVLCSSTATMDDCLGAGFDAARLRHVPLGVRPVAVAADDISRVRLRYGLPEEFLLFVGTLEPRKNLARLARAVSRVEGAPPLLAVGPAGWGSAVDGVAGSVRFLGRVPEADLHPLYGAARVFCYPSVMEGFGLPVLEAMSQGTPVVTSRGTSTEEVAGGAAVLVDPWDDDSIASGIAAALADGERLSTLSRRRAAAMSWESTALATAAAYREVVG